jgi:hypothetical protein
MQSVTRLLLIALLLPSPAGTQEPRVRAAPVAQRASDYWAELADVPVPSASAIPAGRTAPSEDRINPVKTPAWQTRYTLGPGDTLNFSVYAREDLERENVQIAPDGTVSYLQAVAVRAQGLTLDQLRTRIASQGMRNSNVIAIAPTATISNIMGSTPCIEPVYKNLFAKSNLSGEFTQLNPYLVRDLKSRGLWNQEMLDRIKYYDGELAELDEIPADVKEKYLTAFGIDYQWIIAAAARRQKWIDQSQSVNLWLASPDMKVLSHMYRAAWHSGLKTTYYLRTTSASNIEKTSVKLDKQVRITADSPRQDPSEAEKLACTIDAMRDGNLTTSPRAWGADEADAVAGLALTVEVYKVACVHFAVELKGEVAGALKELSFGWGLT